MLSFTLVILPLLFLSLCHGRLPQRPKVQEQICVFYGAILRVFAVGAVFFTRGTRNVSRQFVSSVGSPANRWCTAMSDGNTCCIGWCWCRRSFSQTFGIHCERACHTSPVHAKSTSWGLRNFRNSSRSWAPKLHRDFVPEIYAARPIVQCLFRSEACLVCRSRSLSDTD